MHVPHEVNLRGLTHGMTRKFEGIAVTVPAVSPLVFYACSKSRSLDRYELS